MGFTVYARFGVWSKKPGCSSTGDRVPEHGCREGRQNEVETKKKKKKGEERGVDATRCSSALPVRLRASLARSVCRSSPGEVKSVPIST